MYCCKNFPVQSDPVSCCTPDNKTLHFDFKTIFVNLLVYLYYSVDFSIVLWHCRLLLCNLAQEFPSGLIKLNKIKSYLKGRPLRTSLAVYALFFVFSFFVLRHGIKLQRNSLFYYLFSLTSYGIARCPRPLRSPPSPLCSVSFAATVLTDHQQRDFISSFLLIFKLWMMVPPAAGDACRGFGTTAIRRGSGLRWLCCVSRRDWTASWKTKLTFSTKRWEGGSTWRKTSVTVCPNAKRWSPSPIRSLLLHITLQLFYLTSF